MNQDNYSAQIIGVFLAETVKNVAKGSANILYNNFNLLFYSEITTLGLNDSTNAEEITKHLEAKPEVLETVRQKLNAHPNLVEEMSKTIKEQTGKDLREITSNTYIEKGENITINQTGVQTAQTITNITPSPLPSLPKISLTPIITFQREYIFGSQDEHYGWQIKLLNDGEATVRDFRVDIKFPNVFLNQSTIYHIEVREKRTDDYRLFRTTSAHHNNVILYQEDEYLVFLGSYTLNKAMRENGNLERKVFITVFSSDTLICKIERKMSEFVDDDSK